MTGWTTLRRRGGDGGFTLVEVLVVVTIVGITAFALTEAVILGLRTTDSTAATSARFIATQTLSSYFTGDAQSADEVSSTDPNGCAPGPVLVVVSLAWTDQTVKRTVAYGLDPATGAEQDLVRWSCTGGFSARKVLGHLGGAPDTGQPYVSVMCDGATCPATLGAPGSVTLQVRSDPMLSLTVQRRTAG